MRTRLSVVFAAALAVALSSSAAVTGVVVDARSKPVAGATISLFPVESPLQKFDRMLTATDERTPLVRVTAQSDGTFSVEAPHPGAYVVHVTAAGFVPDSLTVEHDEALGSVVLATADLREGTLTYAGKRVADARIVISYGGAELATRTDREGRFRAPAAGPGTMLFVSHPDHGTHTTSVRPNQRTLAVEIPTHGALRGRVVAPDGKTPVAGAIVRAGEALFLAKSKADGTFSAPHARLNPVVISAEHPDGLAFRRITDGDSLELQLEAPTRVTGTVTDAETKHPIAGAIVVLTARNGMPHVSTSDVTDAKGRFSVAALEAANLDVSHPGYGHESFALDGDASTMTKNVAIRRLARVSGVVLDEAREPVAGAVVVPESARDSMGSLGWSPGMPRRTAADGRFTLRVPPDREFLLVAAAQGTPPASSAAFTLAAGARKDDIVITIPKGISVTGRVTDQDGTPLGGIAVNPAGSGNRRGSSGFLSHITGAVRTNADGNYTLHVDAGTYDFKFHGDGWAERVVAGREISASAVNIVDASLQRSVAIRGRVVREGNGVGGVHVYIPSGGNSPSTMTAPDGSFTLDGLTPGKHLVLASKQLKAQLSVDAPADDVIIEFPVGGRIDGRVTARATGSPITSFRAGFAVKRSGPGFSSSSSPTLFPFTDPDGRFTLTELPQGGVDIIVEADGYAAARRNVVVEEEPGEPVTLALDPGSRLVGRVTTPDGKAISHARISGGPASLPNPMFGDHHTTTDASGQFEIGGLSEGDWAFGVSHPQHGRLTKRVTLRGRETRIDVRFEAGVEISGVVVTTTGLPVANANVSLTSPESASENVRTNDQGVFTVSGLTPGRYRVTAERNGYVRTVLEEVEIGTGAQTALRVELDEGGTIHGQVSGLTKEELQRASVHAISRADRATTGIAPDGTYRLEHTPPGRVRVVAIVEEGMRAARTSPPKFLEIASGGDQRHDIAFANDLTVEGAVRRRGAPLSGSLVTFTRTDGPGTSVTVRTGADGEYRAPGLTPGSYTIEVFDDARYVRHTTTRDIDGPSRVDIDFDTARLRGRVLDATTRQAIEFSTVIVQPFDSEYGSRLTTDRTGAFVLDSMSTGSYELRARADGYDTSVATVEISPGENERTVEILLRRKRAGTP